VSYLPTDFDRQMMHRCLALAQTAQGKTAPNPMVGAVVVNNGEIVGEGFHPGAGQPHAEVFALRAAGDRATGATIYVSLEPCNHHGRTPPCSEAVIAAGIKKVVVGMVDPNPLVAGGGIERLHSAGLEVVTGVETVACEQLNEGFIQRMRYQRPLGILKYAMTIDGKISTTTGHSAWVSSPDSRHYVHQLRSTCDAIVTGGNTLRCDNPLLTSHEAAAHNPLRVVLSRQLDLPAVAQLWDTTVAPTLVMTLPGANLPLQKILQGQGVEIVTLEQLHPELVMKYLFDRGFSTVLWECGGTLAAEAIRYGAIQKVLTFIAPKIVGGHSTATPVGELNILNMNDALVLEQITWQQIGVDMLMQGYLKSVFLTT
jgi:diaminohydroxyphosphoribosylaminopyrimidine deaminase / 5-amino-6-(5-phosphoribosylamino)uracil reductase